MKNNLYTTRSYVNVVGAGTAMIGVTYGLARYSYGLFLPHIQQSLHINIFWLGILGSSSYVGYLIATLIGTVVSGRTGPRLPLLLGGITAVVGMLLVSISSSLTLLFIGIIIAGMSPGLAYPPLSDILVMRISHKRRDTAFSIINAGTSFGVIVAAPMAILAGSKWKLAWLIFAVIALITTIWNYLMSPKNRMTPTEKNDNEITHISFKWLLNKNSIRLFLYCLFLGIVSSSLWTYSVAYIQLSKTPIYLAGNYYSPLTFSTIYWIIIGTSGVFGVFAGKFVNKFGMKLMVQSVMLSMAISALLVVASPTNGLILIASSILFGIAFMLGTAYIGIWSINLFYSRPSAGMGFAFLTLSLGQLVGPIFFGFVAHISSLYFVFIIAGIAGIICTFIRPKINIYNMTP